VDELALHTVPAPQDYIEPLEAVPWVNGVSLIDLARAVERQFAAREGHPEIAGGYHGLPGSVALGPGSVLLGRLGTDSAALYLDEGQLTVLCCECGEPGCWPLTTRLEVDADLVIWRDFEQPHRAEWDLSTLGPFVFDRRQYEDAVTGVSTSPARS
jgi:hypothetical protein